MASTFEYLDKYLEKVGLERPNLQILEKDANEYNTLAYQHKGKVEASREGGLYVRNKDREITQNKFEGFFQLAIDEDIQLALTPEYSCPWGNIEKLVENNSLPGYGNLWIIGCESILPSELEEVIENHESETKKFILERDLLETDQEKFLDPICYFFKTRIEGTDEEVDVVVIQFKTHPMGESFEYEMDNMLRGTKRYVVRNSISSIYLITLICSGSFDFDSGQDELNFEDKPYLIFHPQLNTSPRSNNFKSYRNYIYNHYRNPQKDTICLNWAKGTTINDQIMLEISCSAIYTKSDAVTEKIDEYRIKKNDELGLYYNYWDSRTGIFTFNSTESIFLFSNYKASQRAEAAQFDRARRGPKMIKAFRWKNSNWSSVDKIKNVELKKYCDEELDGNFDLLLDDTLKGLNKERLLSLTTGHLNSKDWIHPINNLLFKVNNEEKYNRIALFQDPETQDKKAKLLSRYSALSSKFIKDSDKIPEDSHLTDLKEGCQLKYVENNLNSNVTSNKDIPASLVYVGDVPENKAVEIRDIITTAVEKEGGNAERVLVWYAHHGDLRPIYKTSSPSASRNGEESSYSFKKKKVNND